MNCAATVSLPAAIIRQCLLKKNTLAYLKLASASSSTGQQNHIATSPTTIADEDLNQTPTSCGGSLRHPLVPLDQRNPFQMTPQCWVSSMDKVAEHRIGIVNLQPDIFRVFPRLDILQQNLEWQMSYRAVSHVKMLSRAEMPGGGRKLRPNTGLGLSRAGSIRAPNWRSGGFAHGARGPRTRFYMLSRQLRIHGLRVALTIKHAQDDLVLVDSFDSLLTDRADFLHELAEERNWGYSVLFVDNADVAARNLALATEQIPSFNIMPLFGLNVYSMLKHDTLVMSTSALYQLQQRLLFQLRRPYDVGSQFRWHEHMTLDTDEESPEQDETWTPFV